MNTEKSYKDFLNGKIIRVKDSGFQSATIDAPLFPFQKAIVEWACKKGRSAVFADCGLGKTLIQLEWARQVFINSGGMILIVAPLAVSRQTKEEGRRFGYDVNICESQDDMKDGINITNYEKLAKFDTSNLSGVVLDESSILKNFSGKIKKQIIDMFINVRYKLACTATPSPNDNMELLNHAEFLNIAKRENMLATYFVHDSSETAVWRLKKYAVKEFWAWVSSWAVALHDPNDIGYPQAGFDLPELNVITHCVEVDETECANGMLYRVPAMSATDYHKEKRLTSHDRAIRTAEIAASIPGGEQILIWCDANYDADELIKAIPEAIEVRGNTKDTLKESAAMDFAAGRIRILISKASIFGFGMNFQNCHNVIFCGLSYSYESFYQATRRVWRFGQTKRVDCHIIIADTEKVILDTIRKKEESYKDLHRGMVAAMSEFQEINGRVEYKMDYNFRRETGESWELLNGDSCEIIQKLDSDSVGFSIFSPPFSNLYVYSDSYRDMGNAKDDTEFFIHFAYLIPEILRITKPGRICAVHCANIPFMKERDGYIGLRDFRGEIIREFQRHGWIFHSEVCIWKDPLIEATRTKSLGLMHKQLVKDSAICKQGTPDYLVMFRKPGDNTEYISHGPSGLDKFVGIGEVNETKSKNPKANKYSHIVWQKYASPVWMDIRQQNVLKSCKGEEDERHICPLQLDVIERALILWSNPGDIVFSPFAGIGSEGYMSVKSGRRFCGIELKEQYFNQAVENLKSVEREIKIKDTDLISMMEAETE